MLQASSRSLRDFLSQRADSSARFLWATEAGVSLADLANRSSLGGALSALVGRCVLLATPDQLSTALALIELDGIARRLVLCPPGLPDEQLAEVIATAETDAVVSGP